MRPLDIARGAYTRSPRWLRQTFAPVLKVVPTSVKYGRGYWEARDSIERSRRDLAFVAERRLALLRQLVQIAMSGSRFYASRFQEAFKGLPDASAFDFDDLKRLPILTKDDLRENAEAALAVARRNVDAASTSGSSGRPLLFFLDKDRSVREFAFVNSAWARAGYKPGDRRCVLRGLLLANVDQEAFEWEPGLGELRLSPFAMSDARLSRYIELIDQYKTPYLHGYPSAIEILCRFIGRTGLRPKQAIRGILPISEPIYSHQREIFRSTFPEARIAPLYGLSERVLFASELEDQEDVYEFEPLYGFVELVDENGEGVREPGSVGRIVGTGFLSMGMPFIRYETGDLARLERHADPQNGYRMRVSRITPRRKPEFLVGREGQRIVTPTIVPVHPSKYYGVSEYQFFQEVPGECLIKAVPAQGCGESEVRLFVDELQVRVGSAIHFDCSLVSELAGDARGKRPVIDQRIDLEQFFGFQ